MFRKLEVTERREIKKGTDGMVEAECLTVIAAILFGVTSHH